jgi:hypothetical protein
MSGKHVHFSAFDILYSPTIPPTPWTSSPIPTMLSPYRSSVHPHLPRYPSAGVMLHPALSTKTCLSSTTTNTAPPSAPSSHLPPALTPEQHITFSSIVNRRERFVIQQQRAGRAGCHTQILAQTNYSVGVAHSVPENTTRCG